MDDPVWRIIPRFNRW